MPVASKHEHRSPAIACPLRAAAADVPDHPAIRSEECLLSFEAWDGLADGVARKLEARGLEAGARVALWMDRSWKMLVFLLGCWRAGMVAVPLSTRLPDRAITAHLQHVSAAVLVTDRSFSLTGLKVPVLSDDDLLVSRKEQTSQRAPAPSWVLTAPASIVFTSGSTGSPKAALHSLGNHVWSAEGANANMPLASGDRWLLALPLYHVGGLGIVLRCLLARASIVLAEQGRALPDAIKASSVTHLSLVPTQLRRLLESLDRDARQTLKGVLIGGAPVPPPLLQEAYQRGWPLFTTYGLTEMTSQVTTTSPGASRERLYSAGSVLPHRELRVAESGEIIVRGATLFQGYVEGSRLDPAVDEEGWFDTRDVGFLDEEGDLHVLGRMDNQFISGGENIQPEVIERALCTLEGVHRATVVPVSDKEYGHRPVAFVDTGAKTLAPDRWREFLEERLPRFLIPDRFYQWPEMDEGMKVSRADLQADAKRR